MEGEKRPLRHLNFEIDKLTNSIENTLSGEVFDTVITQLAKSDLKLVKKKDWQFDWKLEFRASQNEVYKLTTIACKTLSERGYEGWVAFDSKTVLIEHYKKTLGATHFDKTKDVR